MKFYTLMILVGLALNATSALAQGFQIPWSTIGAGGGHCVGGSFSVNGLIGQPAVAAMTSSDFAITGGFWSGVAVAAPQSPPVLSIRRGAGNMIALFWPRSSAGYVLEESMDLGGPGGGWSSVTTPPVVVGSNLEVKIPATGVGRFFRLRPQ
jgi:hypothetical protein